MDETDRRILNRIQADFPIVERPFRELGAALENSEADTIARIRRLKHDERVIRQVSGIFDTRGLGYRSSLVAAAVAHDRIEEAAAVISSHPGVSHNYERNHRFNLWFTIAVPPEGSLERTVARLGELARVDSIRLLPTIRVFKIAVNLDVAAERGETDKEIARPAQSGSAVGASSQLSSAERAFVCEMQRDIEIIERPFESAARALGRSCDELRVEASRLQRRGVLRRFAAVLRHRQAGFVANGMAVWNVAGGDVERVGRTISEYQAVSHCYQRPSFPDWSYSVFSMIHARTEDAVRGVAAAIARDTGVGDYSILFSTREFKKARVVYFTDDIPRWERENMNGA